MFSQLSQFMHRLAGLFRAPTAPVDPDMMSLHEWADLPAHHPRRDRAPC